jgi:hypothetical protein
MRLRWILGAVLVLLLAGHASAVALQVTLIPELSNDKVWRLEVINRSVDALEVQRLIAILLADGRRLWSQQVTLTPSLLRPGEAGWIAMAVARLPKRLPIQIDWELTWNPHPVPVLPRFWRTERVASIEIRPRSPSTPAAEAPAPRRPRTTPPSPLWRF